VDAAQAIDHIVLQGTCFGTTVVGQAHQNDLLTITGRPASNLVRPTLDGEHLGPVIQVGPEPGGGGTVRLVDVTVTHGTTGIFVRGALMLRDSVVTENDGSGILADDANEAVIVRSWITHNGDSGITNSHSFVSISDSRVSENAATGDGGGILNETGNGLSVSHSLIVRNTAAGDGGGISSGFDTHVDISDSVIAGNVAMGDGGGIDFRSPTGQDLTITRSIVAANTAGLGGGGIFHDDSPPTGHGEVVVTDTAVQGNTAQNLDGLEGDVGGGVAECDDGLDLEGSTQIAHNHPDDLGTAYCGL
jgi:hypothetical protein